MCIAQRSFQGNRHTGKESLTGITEPFAQPSQRNCHKARDSWSSVLPKLPELQLALCCSWATLQGPALPRRHNRRELDVPRSSCQQPPAQTHSAASPLLTFSVVQLLRYSGRILPMLPFSGNSWITSRPRVRAGREAWSSRIKSGSRCWDTHALLYTGA